MTLHAITVFSLEKPTPVNVTVLSPYTPMTNDSIFDISEANEINWGANDQRKDAPSFEIFRNPGPSLTSIEVKNQRIR